MCHSFVCLFGALFKALEQSYCSVMPLRQDPAYSEFSAGYIRDPGNTRILWCTGGIRSPPHGRDCYRCLRNKRPSKLHEFNGFGAIDVTKPYSLMWFGDMHGPKP